VIARPAAVSVVPPDLAVRPRTGSAQRAFTHWNQSGRLVCEGLRADLSTLLDAAWDVRFGPKR